mgnify:CR=1 FL=1
MIEQVAGTIVLSSHIKQQSDIDVFGVTIQPTAIQERKEPIDEEYEKLLAFIYINGCDKKKTGKLVENLANDYAKATSDEQKEEIYPKKVSDANNTVANYRNYVNNPHKNKKRDVTTSFAQSKSNDKD